MKKILTLAAAAAVLYSCGNNENRYVVEGNLEGINETVYLFDRQQQLLDSAKVENGAFRIEGVAEAPTSAILTDARDMRGTFGVMLILEPGTITVARSEQEQNALFATGTVSNDANTAYMTAGSELIREFRDPETTDERREAIEEEYEELGSQTLEQNRNNYFGVVMLSQQAYGLSGQEILDEIALFPAELQQTGEMTKIRENAEQKLKTDVGQPYIDVVQPDADGKEVSLKSVVENPATKYVLLDFWSLSCPPCLMDIRDHYLRDYAAYREAGFEILGVARNTDEDLRGNLPDLGIVWPVVADRPEGRITGCYRVDAYPTLYLIDPRGRIVAEGSDLRGERLSRWLRQAYPGVQPSPQTE